MHGNFRTRIYLSDFYQDYIKVSILPSETGIEYRKRLTNSLRIFKTFTAIYMKILFKKNFSLARIRDILVHVSDTLFDSPLLSIS